MFRILTSAKTLLKNSTSGVNFVAGQKFHVHRRGKPTLRSRRKISIFDRKNQHDFNFPANKPAKSIDSKRDILVKIDPNDWKCEDTGNALTKSEEPEYVPIWAGPNYKKELDGIDVNLNLLIKKCCDENLGPLDLCYDEILAITAMDLSQFFTDTNREFLLKLYDDCYIALFYMEDKGLMLDELDLIVKRLKPSRGYYND